MNQQREFSPAELMLMEDCAEFLMNVGLYASSLDDATRAKARTLSADLRGSVRRVTTQQEG